MKFAYADPPYLCGAHLYKKHHPEWAVYADIQGHAALISRLVEEYPDGWALSMAAPDIVHMAPLLPKKVRWGAWVKPFASFKPGVNPGYCWEPVAFMGGRKYTRQDPTIRDFVSERITLKKGLTGAKPPAFCTWVLDLWGFQNDDTVDDLFPGTGIFGEVLATRRAA